MKQIIFLFAIASTVLFSCSKEKIDAPASSATQKMTELKFPNTTITMTYDKDGRIQTMHRIAGAYVYDFEFSYAPGKVFHQSFLAGKKSITGEYTMVNGKATTHDWQEFDGNGNVMYDYHDKFVYDAKGQLEKRIYTNGAYWLYTFNSDGDISKAAYYDENGIVTRRSEFEYWDKPNKFPYMTDNNNTGELFFVPGYSKHLGKVRRFFDMPGDIKTYEVKYDYLFNPAGYVIQTTGTDLFPAFNQWSFTAKFE